MTRESDPETLRRMEACDPAIEREKRLASKLIETATRSLSKPGVDHVVIPLQAPPSETLRSALDASILEWGLEEIPVTPSWESYVAQVAIQGPNPKVFRIVLRHKGRPS